MDLHAYDRSLSNHDTGNDVMIDDPLLGQLPDFLAYDIANHPERLQVVDASLVERFQSLVGGIKVDLDAALSVDDKSPTRTVRPF